MMIVYAMISTTPKDGGYVMSGIFKKLVLLTAVMMLFGLFGCSKAKKLDINDFKGSEPNTMLADYFDRVVGTIEKQPYYELVMYTYSDKQVLLEEYRNGGSDEEELRSYLVPVEAAQEVFDVIHETGMDTWNSRENGMTALSGMAYVCKFPDGKGDYERVTSDHLPEDGTRAFGEVKVTMSKYLKDEYLTEE